jgi:hypothetical protein
MLDGETGEIVDGVLRDDDPSCDVRQCVNRSGTAIMFITRRRHSEIRQFRRRALHTASVYAVGEGADSLGHVLGAHDPRRLGHQHRKQCAALLEAECERRSRERRRRGPWPPREPAKPDRHGRWRGQIRHLDTVRVTPGDRRRRLDRYLRDYDMRSRARRVLGRDPLDVLLKRPEQELAAEQP